MPRDKHYFSLMVTSCWNYLRLCFKGVYNLCTNWKFCSMFQFKTFKGCTVLPKLLQYRTFQCSEIDTNICFQETTIYKMFTAQAAQKCRCWGGGPAISFNQWCSSYRRLYSNSQGIGISCIWIVVRCQDYG